MEKMNYVMQRFLADDSTHSEIRFPIRKMPFDDRQYLIRFGHISNPQDFWVVFANPNFPEDDYKALVQELNRVYSTNEEEKTIPYLDNVKLGDHLLCQSGMNYCRGMVHAIRGPDIVDVVDLDIGDLVELRSMDMLFPIIENSIIRKTPMCSFHCTLGGIAPKSRRGWTEEITKKFEDEYGKLTPNCSFVDIKDEVYVVNLSLRSGRPIADHMLAMCLCSRPSHALALPTTYPRSLNQFPIGEEISVVVCYVETSARFYVQLDANGNLIQELSNKVHGEYVRNHESYDEEVSSASRGEVCAAKYDRDNFWYRAMVIQRYSPDLIDVQFVDFGNVFRASDSKLKKLKKTFVRTSVQAYECKLKDCEENRFSTEQLSDVILNKRMKIIIAGVDVTETGAPQFIVTLYSHWKNRIYSVNDYMRGKGSAAPFIPALHDQDVGIDGAGYGRGHRIVSTPPPQAPIIPGIQNRVVGTGGHGIGRGNPIHAAPAIVQNNFDVRGSGIGRGRPVQ